MMKRLISSLSIALASTSLAAAAPAIAEPVTPAAEAAAAEPSAEQIALARKFVALTFSTQETVDAMLTSFLELAATAEDEAGAEAQVHRLMARLEPKVREAMPSMLEAYSKVYARGFSQDDLRQMIAFAETPAGKAYFARHEALASDPIIVEAQWLLMDEMAPAIEDFQKELCAERAALQVAAGDVNAKCPLSGDPETLAG